MTETGKNRWWSLGLVLITAIITMIITAYANNETYDKNKLDLKLDKTVFEERKKEVDYELDLKMNKDVFIMYLENQKIFIENQKIIQADIKDILKQLK